MRSFVSLIILALIFSCQNPKKSTPDTKPFFKISLAQWSFHKAFRENGVSPYEFAKMANELGFEGLEYVSQLYPDVMESNDKVSAIQNFIEKNNSLALQYNLKNVLIMIDEEGDLSSSDDKERNEAIENHKAWIEAANKMGCSAVRINLHGEKEETAWIKNSIESIQQKFEKNPNFNKKISIEISNNNDHIKIILIDNGIGFSQNNNIKDILNPYYTTKKNGTGLGLSIVNKIINDHHGELEFYSIKDGAKIEIKFKLYGN